jgi:competence protein ComEA
VGRVKGVGEGNATRFSKEGLTVNGVTFTPSEHAGKAEPKKDKPGKKDSKG